MSVSLQNARGEKVSGKSSCVTTYKEAITKAKTSPHTQSKLSSLLRVRNVTLVTTSHPDLVSVSSFGIKITCIQKKNAFSKLVNARSYGKKKKRYLQVQQETPKVSFITFFLFLIRVLIFLFAFLFPEPML